MDDNEIKFSKLSTSFLRQIYSRLRLVLWKTEVGNSRRIVHGSAREKDLEPLLAAVDMFQDNPQLLDVHLPNFVPQIGEAYIESLQRSSKKAHKVGRLPIGVAIGKLLYVFCKVRGEKVIVGLLNNEPKYLELMLQALEEASHPDGPDNAEHVWEERYVLLLWISHLLLAPFDLASISTEDAKNESCQVELPDRLPGLAKRIVPICLKYVKGATKEQRAAAILLSRLCLRPDMRKAGLLDVIAKWMLESLRSAESGKAISLYESLGKLYFLNRVIASGSKEEIGYLAAKVVQKCQSIHEDDGFRFLKSSAIARKFILKISRNIAVMALKFGLSGIDLDAFIESLVSLLLESLTDTDTPVRLAASKSLSIITHRLDPDTADEVVDAILTSLNENILWNGDRRDLTAVNSLQWHGLTLTLAHILFRRAAPPKRLPDMLTALLLALNFEQRSATGSSVGTNVRDAANFGIWALSRRYTTGELLSVDVSRTRGSQKSTSISSVLQLLAVELVQSGCLDPVGNIRRGSSAALQELIGRHPDTITNGIDLVQLVDYQAVGLLSTAMHKAQEAAALDPIYWYAMYEALLGWRGAMSVDFDNRVHAANTMQSLCDERKRPKSYSQLRMLRSIVDRIRTTNPSKIEERHGLVCAVSAVIAGMCESRPGKDVPFDLYESAQVQAFEYVFRLAKNPDIVVQTEPEYYRSVLRRPETTTHATLGFIRTIGTVFHHCGDICVSIFGELPSLDVLANCVELCIRRPEPSLHENIISAVRSFAPLFDDFQARVNRWMHEIHAAGPANRLPGLVIALGVAVPSLSHEEVTTIPIVKFLVERCTEKVQEDARVVALRSLRYLLISIEDAPTHKDFVAKLSGISEGILAGLNDFTINERGDVGSLVRMEALRLVPSFWKSIRMTAGTPEQQYLSKQAEVIAACACRLAVEKLDRVRDAAFEVNLHDPSNRYRIVKGVLSPTQHSTSTSAYFTAHLALLSSPLSTNYSQHLVEGYSSTAGTGSEYVLQAARAAFEATENGFLHGSDDSEMGIQGNTLALYAFITNCIAILQKDLTDRAQISILETLAFLGDFGQLDRLLGQDLPWKTLLSRVQQSHYKSANIQKIIAALDVYRSLARIASLRQLVLKKVKSMLLHHYPKVRVAAAETLFLTTGTAEVKSYDWSRPRSALKEHLAKISI